jgi:hypothetical protein
MEPKKELKAKNLTEYKSMKSAVYLARTHMRSSQFSNFYYPIIGQRIESKIHNRQSLNDRESFENDKDDLMTQGNAPNLKIPDILKEDGGWITPENIDDLEVRGEKMTVIINDILSSDGKHAVYTRFKTYYGSRLLGTLFDIYGITYRFYDGDMNDDLRLKVLKEYNSEDNDDGSQVKVIILTEAGAEGINLLCVRKFHILEQDVNMTKMKQVLGRANRYRSHARLPPVERTLEINNYIIRLQDIEATKKWSPDILCYESALKKDISINEIKKLLSSCST